MKTVSTNELISGLLDKSRREGRDLFEVMEADGLILTPAKRRQVMVDTMTAMLFILDRETAEKLLQTYLGGRPATAQDMFDAMREWLSDYRDALAAGYVG